MEPIGLTLKDIKRNPFTSRITGELMIVHRCVRCGKISKNRIAGDDNEYSLISLLEKTEDIDHQKKHIDLLMSENKKLVRFILFGESDHD